MRQQSSMAPRWLPALAAAALLLTSAGAASQDVRVAPNAPQSYTVQKGDSLSKIAKKHLGDGNAWRKIYEANKALIGEDPDKIFPGQTHTLPSGASPTSPGGSRTA